MSRTELANQSPGLILRHLPGFPVLNWLTFLFDLYQVLRRWLKQNRNEGLYENLVYDVTLELTDSDGKTASFKKHQRVKFLQNEINIFQDYAWGDGDILTDYHCSPGKVVDTYKDADKWNILISLRETKSAGDQEDFYISRNPKNSLTEDEEWLQTEIRHQTKRLKMTIIFPKERECKSAVLEERSRNRATVLGPEHFSYLPEPDGRQILTWETEKIRMFEVYTLKWNWPRKTGDKPAETYRPLARIIRRIQYPS